MAELALSMSSVSLTFQVFSGCIQAYQILCDAKHFPSDCQYLRVRLKTEQYRLLDWAEVVQLDTTDDKLLISNSSKGLLLDILDQKRRLLFQFGRYDDKYRELGKPLLVAEDGSDITDTQPTNSTASKKENPPRMIRKNSDFQVQFPGSTTLLQKSLEYARKTKSSQIRSVRWVTFDKKKFEKLIWKLATFNDFMREMLSTIQLDNLATKQTRTELQINQLNESIQNLLKIYESSGAGSSKTERLKLTLHSPLREYLRANGLTDLEGDGTDSGTSSSLNSPNTFEQVKALQQSLLNRTTISQPEYFIPLESAPTATSATEDAAQKRADGINAEPSARQQDDMPRSLSPFPGRLFIQDTRSSVGSDIDPRQSSFSTGISEAATLVSSFKSLVHALNTTVEQEAAKLYYESPEIEILDVGPAADEPPILISSSHMLPEKADIISQQTWKDLVQLLPESLRLGLQYNELDGSSCWTYTPNPAFTPTSIPLTIAGIPVVIPLKYRYPIRAPSGAPPDPYPFKIDPTAMASSTIVDAIFNTFSDILGFYILINGFLQLLIPEDYDLEDALQRYPTRFGDLKISYVPFCVLSTGSASEAPIAEASSSTSNAPDHLRVSRGLGIVERTAAWAALSTSRIMANRTISSSASIHQLDFSSTLRARVLKQRSPSWFGGKPGVLTRKGSKQFLTFSTHVATKALEEAKHKFSSDESWTERVEVYHGNLKVGNVCQTFDPSASEQFPDGIEHDISLIDVSDKNALILAKLKAPKECQWLSSEEWINMRLTKTNISLLRNDRMRSKTITLSESREQVVGQGIFRNIQESRTRAEARKARSRGESPMQQIHKWSSFVSRAVLYRVDPDFEEPRTNSGTAVCVMDEETGAHKVAGFQSFVQETDGGQYYELEEDPFLDMLRLGSVSFYGAFRVPDGLRGGFEIVTEE